MSDNDVVIRVEGLGKKYSLHHEQPERYQSLRDVWVRQAKAAGRWLNPFTLAGQLRQARRYAGAESGASEEEFWALKDVSFEIRRGERVGIIGRNGAGKSTLLKILSRITEPTTGRVEIRGRVASLLEVGTGFHPELTGRENIYLNGAILGMTRREIRAKFDEIVDFAEVEKFLDTPVKRYSSGMYVRLAFAVAAHLEPEVLVVDEVLAVGDDGFQKKCLGKMGEVSDIEGRTVLFVSHNLGHISNLCSQAILFCAGELVCHEKVEYVVSKYLNTSQSSYRPQELSLPMPDCPARIAALEIMFDGVSGQHAYIGQSLELRVALELFKSNFQPKIGYVIYSADGTPVVSANNRYQKLKVCHEIEGQSSYLLECRLGMVPLMAGSYYVSLWLGDVSQDFYCLEQALWFEVHDKDIWGTGKLPNRASHLWWPTEFSLKQG